MVKDIQAEVWSQCPGVHVTSSVEVAAAAAVTLSLMHLLVTGSPNRPPPKLKADT